MSDMDMSYISYLKNSYCVKFFRFDILKEFSFNVYGSSALKEAIKFRDSIYKKYSIGPRNKKSPNVRFDILPAIKPTACRL